MVKHPHHNNFPPKSKAAIEKKITIPVTSTNVATNGADAVAGSNLNFFSIKGIIEPDNVPQSTTKTSDSEMLMPIHTQYLP